MGTWGSRGGRGIREVWLRPRLLAPEGRRSPAPTDCPLHPPQALAVAAALTGRDGWSAGEALAPRKEVRVAAGWEANLGLRARRWDSERERVTSPPNSRYPHCFRTCPGRVRAQGVNTAKCSWDPSLRLYSTGVTPEPCRGEVSRSLLAGTLPWGLLCMVQHYLWGFRYWTY